MKSIFYKLIVSVVIFLMAAGAQAQIINTVAGTGAPAYSASGGPAISALLAGPTGVAFDPGGTTMYISDSATNLVHKVDLATGIISVFAGSAYLMSTGGGTFGGDGGPAIAARLNHPMGLAIDLSGNLLIADMGNHRIRKVNPGTGIINTMTGNGIAGHTGDGGSSLVATLNNPVGIRMDASGKLYIADRGNNCIRRVSSGVITTVAGDTTAGYTIDGGPATGAELNVPSGIAADGTGNIYISDRANNCIRLLTRYISAISGRDSTYVISTYAGIAGPVGGWSGDGGPATAAHLNSPCGIAFNLYHRYLFIADSGNHRVRMIDTRSPGNPITTYAGNGTAGFSGDGGLATAAQLNGPTGVTVAGSNGDVLIADCNNQRIRRVGFVSNYAGGGIVTYAGDGTVGHTDVGAGVPATNASFNHPTGIVIDGKGQVYVADRDNNCVRRIRTYILAGGAGEEVSTYAGSPSGVAGYGADLLYAPLSLLRSPTDVSVDNHSNLYITDYVNNVIRRVDSATQTITTFSGINLGTGAPGTAGYGGDFGLRNGATVKMDKPRGVCVDTFGNIIVGEAGNHVVRRIGGVVLTYQDTITTVGGIAGAPGYGGRGSSLLLKHPTGVGPDGLGNVYIADSGNNIIRMLDSHGVLHDFAGNFSLGSGYAGDGSSIIPTTTAGPIQRFNGPIDVAVNPEGDVYITDQGNNRVRWIDMATGNINAYPPATSTTPVFSLPHGIAFFPAIQHDLYLADKGNYAVKKVDSSSLVVSTVAGTSGTAGISATGAVATLSACYEPYAVAVDGTSNSIFIADYGNNLVRRVDLTTGLITNFLGTGVAGSTLGATPTTSQINNPTGLAIFGTNLYVVDQSNCRILKVDVSGASAPTLYAGVTGSVGYINSPTATTARFYYPTGIAFNAAGDAFVGDGNNNVVRKIAAGGGAVSTFAGTGGAPAFGGDGGPAASAKLADPKEVAVDASDNVYISDFGNHVIRKVSIATLTISTVAGDVTSSTSTVGGFSGDGPAVGTMLNNPTGIVFDDSGRLNISDFGNNRIRRIDGAGNMITIGGLGTPGYSGDGGAATAAELFHPFGLASDAGGNIYIADRDNNVVRRIRYGILAGMNVLPGTTICQDSCITLINNSLGGYTSISWDVSPGSTPAFTITPVSASADTETVCFPMWGTYTVRIIATGPTSADTAYSTITVTASPHPTMTLIPGTDTLIIHGSYNSYQWCNNGVPMVGYIDSFFELTVNGNYTCIVDSNGCLGTSTAYNNLKVDNVNGTTVRYWLARTGTGPLNLYTSQAPTEALTVTIVDATGRLVRKEKWAAGTANRKIDNVDSWPPGLYLIRLNNDNTSHVLKWNKTN